MSGTDLCCWIVRYDDLDGNRIERYLDFYPVGQEENPWSDVLIAGWSVGAGTDRSGGGGE